MRTSTMVGLAAGAVLIAGVMASADPPKSKGSPIANDTAPAEQLIPAERGPVTDSEPMVAPSPIPDGTVTREQFDRLQINMFREQVTKIMGTPGVNQSTQGGLGMDQLDTVTWGNTDGSEMVLTFRNGLLASKTQFRLP